MLEISMVFPVNVETLMLEISMVFPVNVETLMLEMSMVFPVKVETYMVEISMVFPVNEDTNMVEALTVGTVIIVEIVSTPVLWSDINELGFKFAVKFVHLYPPGLPNSVLKLLSCTP